MKEYIVIPLAILSILGCIAVSAADEMTTDVCYTYDECGVCGGSGNTCGGCDGHGGEYDACGVCGGDNSTCTCVRYHGFHVSEMEYVLLRFSLGHTLTNLDTQIDLIMDLMSILKTYQGNADLGTVVKYINGFYRDCLAPYIDIATQLYDEIVAGESGSQQQARLEPTAGPVGSLTSIVATSN